MTNRIIPLDKPVKIAYRIYKSFNAGHMAFTQTATSVCITYRDDGSFFNFQVLDEEGVEIRSKHCDEQWYNDIFNRYTGYEKVPAYNI